MSKEKITIEDLATMIQREFTSIRSDFNGRCDGIDNKIEGIKNDIHSLTHRFNEHDKEQKKIVEKLDADTFALKHLAKDHENASLSSNTSKHRTR